MQLSSELVAALEGLSDSWEIVFVDDGSQDGTFELLREVSTQRRPHPRRPTEPELRTDRSPPGRLLTGSGLHRRDHGRRSSERSPGHPKPRRQDRRGVRRRLGLAARPQGPTHHPQDTFLERQLAVEPLDWRAAARQRLRAQGLPQIGPGQRGPLLRHAPLHSHPSGQQGSPGRRSRGRPSTPPIRHQQVRTVTDLEGAAGHLHPDHDHPVLPSARAVVRPAQPADPRRLDSSLSGPPSISTFSPATSRRPPKACRSSCRAPRSS